MYKLLKVPQPFSKMPYKGQDAYSKFEDELLELLNSGYEIVHTEDMQSEYIHNEYAAPEEFNFKLFILKKTN